MENEIRLIENELVPVYETSTGEKVVYGSELHKILKSKSKFADWVKNRFNDCNAQENIDYDSFSKILEKGGRPTIEYIIKLDTAKEMAMLERNEIGKQVRRYFIQIEKKYKDQPTPPALDIKVLEVINDAAKIILSTVEAVGIEPIHKSYLVKQLYGKAGIEVPTIRIEQETTLYTRTMMAKELGMYSESNRPHAYAVGAIIKKLTIDQNDLVLTSYNKHGHTGVDYQYKPNVLEQVRQWLEDNGYPSIIYNGSTGYSIYYTKAGVLA